MGSFSRGIQEVVTRLLRHPSIPTGLAIASLVVGAFAAITSETAGAIAAGAVLLATVIIVVYGFSIRDRFGGIFEIIDSTHIWDLYAKDGSEASFTKRSHVRFIQNDVLAYPDYVWGDGTQHDYKCEPGEKVDSFQDGNRRCMVISLRRMYKRDEEEDLVIERKILNGFTGAEEWIEIAPVVPAPELNVSIIFPKDRPAKKAIMSRDGKPHHVFADEEFIFDASGRQRLNVKIEKPSARDVVRLKWEW